MDNSAPLVVALGLPSGPLREALAAMLAGVPGLRVAAHGEPADLVLAAAKPAADTNADAPLTPRETQVLALLAEGASNKSIARTLGISVHTAKFHVGQVLDKLDATTRTDAVAQAARAGVIHL
jgi:DNA-binding CsgD family transcriptional regulator